MQILNADMQSRYTEQDIRDIYNAVAGNLYLYNENTKTLVIYVLRYAMANNSYLRMKTLGYYVFRKKSQVKQFNT